MIVVDASVWIDFFRQHDPVIDKRLTGLLEDSQVVAISAVFGELLQGVKNEAEEKVILEFWDSLPKIDEQGLFIEAGQLSRELKLIAKGVGLLDSYILTACKKYNLRPWSLDKKLLGVYSGL